MSDDYRSELNRLKTDFLTGVSHQLRTPLNAILGVTHLALARTESELQRQYLLSIQASSRQLMHSIGNLLDLSRLEQGSLPLEADNFELHPLLDELAAEMQTRLEGRPVAFVLTRDAHIPARLYGDSLRLKQLIRCFTDNAVKFTQRGEIRLQVRLAARSRNSVRLHFTIEDTGTGLPAGVSLGLFRRNETSHLYHHTSDGIGLRIARLLARLMNGDAGLVVHHTPGAAFWFTVQLQPEQATDERTTQPVAQQPDQLSRSGRAANSATVLPSTPTPLPEAFTDTDQLLHELQRRLLLEDFSCLELVETHADALQQRLGVNAIRLHSALHDFDFVRAQALLADQGRA